MANNLYVGSSILISIPCLVDGVAMSAPTDSVLIAYKKPDKSEGQWIAHMNGADKVEYQTLVTDIDQAGNWILQPVVSFTSGATIPGTPSTMPIKARFT